MDKITHEMRLSQWSSVINECHNSGMKIKHWCLANNISEKQFYYWQRRIRKEAYDKNTTTSLMPNNSSFIAIPSPIVNAGHSENFHPDVVLTSGCMRIEISNTVSDALLSRIGSLFNHAM